MENVKRTHRILVPILGALATLALFVGAFAVWVNRQALNTNHWTDTSRKLIANPKIDNALGAYLVNQLFTNVDVAAALQQKLPPQLQPVAGPVAAGLKELAGRAAPKLLATPQVQSAWVQANRVAHKELIRIVEGGGPVVSTNQGEVTLNLHQLVDQLAAQFGIQSQVAAARSKVQGSTGAKVRGAAQQKLGITLPPASGKLVIMRSNQLKTAQDIADAVRSLAVVLPILALVLYALAVWLARGWRRVALRSTGWSFVGVGLLLLLIRRIAGNEVVNGLVKVPQNKPAVHEVWNIATSLLFAIAVALIVYGVLAVIAAWLAGPTRSATWVRRHLAPTLRDHPGMAYSAVGGALLIVVIWGPTPAFRQLGWVLVFGALLALGVTALRRQTAAEFAGVGPPAAPPPAAGAGSGAARAADSHAPDRS